MAETVRTSQITGEPLPYVEYSRELVEDICELIASGHSLYKISQLPGYPAESTFRGWVNGYRNKEIDQAERDELHALYLRAREIQAVRYGELVTETAEQALEPGKNSNEIQGLRLAVDAYKWTAERLAPRRYGAKVDITSDGKPLQVAVVNYAERANTLIDNDTGEVVEE